MRRLIRTAASREDHLVPERDDNDPAAAPPRRRLFADGEPPKQERPGDDHVVLEDVAPAAPPRRRRRIPLVPAALAALILIALALVTTIGGSSDDERDTARVAPNDRPTPQRPVPQGPSAKATPAPKGAERVIRDWTDAVRESDFEKAASFFAVPSRVQNGGPPRILDNPALVIAWNATLPCGAKLVRLTGGPDGFAVAQFELTDRKGSSCGSGTGAPAASAIKVKDGRITEWYRLPDGPPPPGEPVRPAAPAAPGVET